MVLRFPSRRSGKVMISMPKVQSIRRRRMNGESIASIARSENAGGADGAQVPEGGGFVSQAAGQAETRGVGHRPLRAGDSGSGSRRIAARGGRQRHTATRIWERLRDEYGAEVSLSTVTRKVAQLRRGSARGARGRLPRPGVASGRGAGRFRRGRRQVPGRGVAHAPVRAGFPVFERRPEPAYARGER